LQQKRMTLGRIVMSHRLAVALSQVVTSTCALAVALAFGSTSAAAQQRACRLADDEHARILRDYARRLTSGDTSLASTRELYQLPPTKPGDVRIVTDEAVCQRAAQAFHVAVRGDSAPPRARQVAVVQVGRNRFLVLDPEQRQGEYELTVIFDAAWRYLVTLMS
jgi:hypothetical protein